MIDILLAMPKGSEVLVRYGDDAWGAAPKAWSWGGKAQTNLLYLDADPETHHNYPRGYNGTEEIPVKTGGLNKLREVLKASKVRELKKRKEGFPFTDAQIEALGEAAADSLLKELGLQL